MEKDVEDMTTRLTTLADNSRSEVTVIKMDKTCSQHVHKRQCITVIENEMRAVEDTYKHKCDFCEWKFKTEKGMLIHRTGCDLNYGTTDEVFTVEEIVGLCAHKMWDYSWSNTVDMTNWSGDDNTFCFIRDGCHDIIRSFWSKSGLGLQPNKEYYEDPEEVSLHDVHENI